MGTGLSRGWNGRGVALTTHFHLALRLKKASCYNSTPPLGLRGLFYVELYLYFFIIIISIFCCSRHEGWRRWWFILISSFFNILILKDFRFFFIYIYFADRTSQYIYLNINQLDTLNFIMSLFHASTCFEHVCSSSGGQNCTIQPLVSSHWNKWVFFFLKLLK